MDIALVVGQYPNLSKTFINNEIVGLLDRGHNVRIIATSDPQQSEVHEEVEEYGLREKTFYYEQHASSNTLLAGLKLGPTLARHAPNDPALAINILKQIPREGPVATGRLAYYALPFFHEEFDIIHCHFGPKALLGAQLKRVGVPGKLITSFHGYGVERTETGAMYDELFERSACLLGSSQYLCDKLIEFGADPEKVMFHTYSLDTDRFVCEQSEDDDGPVRLVTVARLVENKGISYALSALSDLFDRSPELDVEYHVVGPGPLREELERQASDKGLDSVVTFRGPLARSGVVEELAAADLFVLPSISEGFGKVLLEAQASCTAIVASSVGGIPSAVVPDESALLVPPRDVSALSNAIESLIRDPERRREMGRRGRENIQTNHQVDALNDELIEIYRSVLDTGRPPQLNST